MEYGKRTQKRFQGGRQRQQYTMEQDLWEEDFEGMKDDVDWDEDHGHEEEAAEDWDFYVFQQSSSSFPLALRNTARTITLLTRTQLRGVTNCIRRKEKERHPKAGILFFSLKAPKARAKVKEKARVSQAKARAIAKAKT